MAGSNEDQRQHLATISARVLWEMESAETAARLLALEWGQGPDLLTFCASATTHEGALRSRWHEIQLLLLGWFHEL